MVWFEKIREDARGIFKAHPASIISVFICCLAVALNDDILFSLLNSTADKVFMLIEYFSFTVSFGLLACECNYAYKKSAGKIGGLQEFKKSFVYLIVTLISCAMGVVYGLFNSFLKKETGNYGSLFEISELFDRFLWVYFAVCICGALYFLYKRTGESFEGYSVKAFLGTLKAQVVYGVVSLGTLCILWVFDSLIVRFNYIMTAELLILSLVGYPALLVGLSKPGEKLSRFSEIIIGYVFTGILAIAAVIVYVYIFKIVVTWTFPSNEAYTIVTALFATGIVIWTMAQGCTEGIFYKIMRILPLCFIPFIVVQIMCLSMRISQYGITTRRYLGIMVVIFEIAYLVYYIFRMIRGLGIAGFLFPVVLAFVIVYYLVPGINVYAAITFSQKGIVEQYVKALETPAGATDKLTAQAKSAFHQIKNNGGIEGRHYMDDLLTAHPDLDTKSVFGGDSDSYYEDRVENEEKIIFAYHTVNELDISNYQKLYRVDCTLIEDKEPIDPTHFEITADSNNEETYLTTIDLSTLTTTLEDLYDNGADSTDYENAIKEPIRLPDSSMLYLTEFDLQISEDGTINYLEIAGYYLSK
jgi:hypothetical protein